MMNFKSVRTSYTSKVIISFLTIQLILGGIYPSVAFAAPEGPTQPEFNSFTPIGVSDMVDLSSGDFSYSIPVMDVGGYPLSLGYSSATNFDNPSSWVGHGWDLSAGQINRSMRVIPDDFNGQDRITTENNQKDNTTVTVGTSVNISLAGFDISDVTGKPTEGLGLEMGLTAIYNNYTGLSMQPSFGPTFSLHNGFTSEINFTPSSSNGVVIQPQVGFNGKFDGKNGRYGIGLNFNSFTNNLSVNPSFNTSEIVTHKTEGVMKRERGASSSLSFLDFQPSQFNPSYQLGYTNLAGSGNFATGGSFFGIDGKPEIYGSLSNQSLKKEYKKKEHRAFGYSNNHLAGYDGMRDFSRRNDRSITIGTSFLPVPQNTYDYYSISGQGVSGSFRPQNAQVGYVGDPEVVNTSADLSLAGELAGGNLFKIGGNISASYSDSRSGYWKQHKGNNAHEHLRSINDPLNDNTLPANFQRNYFKLIGQNTLSYNLDPQESNDFINRIGDKEPVFFKRKNSIISNGTTTASAGGSMTDIDAKYNKSNLSFNTPTDPVAGEMVMKNVIPTSKTIVPVSVLDYNLNNSYTNDIQGYGLLNKTFVPGINNGSANIPISKKHHQAGFKVTDDGGAIYNYDLPLYTVNSSQMSFSISDKATKTFANSQVKYANQDNSLNNRKGRDHFYEKRTIDPYVHTSLLRSILSPDYRDLTGNGVSPDDLGSYTLFKYKKTDKLIPFRLPVEKNQAFYQQGTISSKGDDKASINYGEKEQAFLERVITKTHVAYFQLNDDNTATTQRKDNLGSSGENGDVDSSMRSRYLSKIYLYTLAQAEKIGLLNSDISNFDPYSQNNIDVKPLKVAHFEYDYSIQKNTTGKSLPNSVSNNGKLTLKKVYFTYGNSEMGRYNPYTFNYNQDTSFEYHNLNKDTWGNYMPIGSTDYSLIGQPTNGEFPYTNRTNADDNISKFLLSEVLLPSGGSIKVNYEADDYAYVQDKKAMKMYNIAGTGSSTDVSNVNFTNQAVLYEGVNKVNDVVFIDVSGDFDWASLSSQEQQQLVESNYLDGIASEPIYFDVFSNIYGDNLTSKYKESISGFVYLEEPNENYTPTVVNKQDSYYLALKLKKPTLNGNTNSEPVHPFSKAVWNYSNTYLKSIAFDGEDNIGDLELFDAVKTLAGSMKGMIKLFSGPNRVLRGKDCGKFIYPNKSWLRLNEPTGFKKGGGARVKSVIVDSNWDLMTQTQTSSDITNYYGQEYDYKSADGQISSGVAVNEPAQNEDNPLKVPLEDRTSVSPSGANTKRLIDKFLAPVNSNYIVGPLMSDYYPNPQVTYSRVMVKNYKPDYVGNSSVNLEISSRATGYVVNEFYTSKDFPVIEKNSLPDSQLRQDNNVTKFAKALIGFPADLESSERYIGTQGFYIETNDMNGRPKSQTVYAEKAVGDNFITKSTTEYQLTEDGKLDNSSVFIDKAGNIIEQEVGVDYDIVNDFRYSSSETYTGYLDGNLVTFTIFLVPITIPMGKPGGSFHETKTRTATTAKHVHRAGIVKSSTVTDNGASITTENIAYDYYSRQPIVRKVNNEFDDVIYNFDYPAYWLIDEMGNKSINEGMVFKVTDPAPSSDAYSFVKEIYNEDSIPLLINGDEVKIEGEPDHLWVTNIQYAAGPGASSFEFIDKDGLYYNTPIGDKKVTVVRSAFDNKQGQSVASISMSKSPINEADGTLKQQLPDFFDEDYLIYNASAIEMKSLWEPDCECGYDKLPRDTAGNIYFDEYASEINPYAHNILGQYRPWKSRAYLTGREKVDMTQDLINLRRDGFYKEFFPFYRFEGTGQDRKLTLPNFDANNSLDLSYQAKHDKWQFASEVSKISPYGLELENKDPLDEARYSSAMYGFNKKFPTAVASNTEYRELAFDSFEDYDYMEHDDEHFAFAKALYHNKYSDGTFTQGDTIIWDNHITSNEHHTGKYSIEISPNQAVGVNQTLVECQINSVEFNNNQLVSLLNLVWEETTSNYSNSSCLDNILINNYINLNIAHMLTSSNGPYQVCDITRTDTNFEFSIWDNNNNQVAILRVQVDPNACFDNYFQNTSTGDFFEIHNEAWSNSVIPEGFDSFVTMDADCVAFIDLSSFSRENRKCIDCTSFAPHQGLDYVVSAWIKEDIDRSNLSTPQLLRDAYPTTYENASVSIAFADVNSTPVGVPQEFDFKPSGQVINGWQKVYGTFKVDSNANVMKVLLNNESSTNSFFFDDIRIHPINGSMKSFVYDDENFRLKAELDDNNYATFYEYDLEGNLIRIKKETSRGIMTIQESRQSLSKQIPQQ